MGKTLVTVVQTQDSLFVRLKGLSPFVKSSIVIGSLFVVSFLAPLGGGYLLHQFWATEPSASVEDEQVGTPLSVRAGRAFVRIAHQEGLNPEPTKDFLLTAWYRPRELPSGKDRVTLFTKHNDNSRAKEGITAVLTAESEGYKVSVSWKDKSGKGRLYQFSNVPLIAQTWFMIGVSLHEGRYLGLHTVTLLPGRKPEVKLVGGYDMTVEIYPDSTNDLIFGAQRSGQFRGQIGPVGIFQGKRIGQELTKTLKFIAAEPSAVPENLTAKEVRFFTADFVQNKGLVKAVITKEGF